MPFDSELILKGLYGGVLVDMDENDAVAVSLTPNTDGNAVVEVKKTGKKGLAAVVVYTEAADADAYDDEALITIEASDELDRNWETVVTFPPIHCHLKEVLVTATTAFVAADIGAALTEETSNDTGLILAIEDALFAIGGVGKILIEMDAAGDLFDAAIGKTETSATTGVGTKNVAVQPDPAQMLPGIYVRRFITNKRYVRCNCAAVDDNMGKVWILIGDDCLDTI